MKRLHASLVATSLLHVNLKRGIPSDYKSWPVFMVLEKERMADIKAAIAIERARFIMEVPSGL